MIDSVQQMLEQRRAAIDSGNTLKRTILKITKDLGPWSKPFL